MANRWKNGGDDTLTPPLEILTRVHVASRTGSGCPVACHQVTCHPGGRSKKGEAGTRAGGEEPAGSGSGGKRPTFGAPATDSTELRPGCALKSPAGLGSQGDAS